MAYLWDPDLTLQVTDVYSEVMYCLGRPPTEYLRCPSIIHVMNERRIRDLLVPMRTILPNQVTINHLHFLAELCLCPRHQNSPQQERLIVRFQRRLQIAMETYNQHRSLAASAPEIWNQLLNQLGVDPGQVPVGDVFNWLQSSVQQGLSDYPRLQTMIGDRAARDAQAAHAENLIERLKENIHRERDAVTAMGRQLERTESDWGRIRQFVQDLGNQQNRLRRGLDELRERTTGVNEQLEATMDVL